MKKVIAIQHQSLLDITIEKYGSVSAVFDLALANNASIEAPVNVGVELIYKTELTVNEVANYFSEKGKSIATLQDFEAVTISGYFPAVFNEVDERNSNSFITQEFQSLMDISLTSYGTIEALFDLALANNTKINNLPVPGTKMNLPMHFKIAKVANYTYKNNIRFATSSPEFAQHLFENGLFENGLFA